MRNAQPAIIRAFFASFAEGILSSEAERQNGTVEMTPQAVKKVMLDHYEDISKNFFDILFNPLAILHYDTAEELVGILRSPDIAPNIKTPMDLIRYACRTDEAHEDMVTEYRRNFSSLLAGKVMSINDFYEGFPEGYLEDSTCHSEREVRALTQVVVKAFFAGRKAAKGESSATGSNQVYLFRLLLDCMQTLLSSAPIEMDDDIDLNAAFIAVCRNEHNMTTMLNTMQSASMDCV